MRTYALYRCIACGGLFARDYVPIDVEAPQPRHIHNEPGTPSYQMEPVKLISAAGVYNIEFAVIE